MTFRITRATPGPIFRVDGRDRLFIRAGVEIAGPVSLRVETELAVAIEALKAGSDYRVIFDGEKPIAVENSFFADADDALGGFHFAPGGNATGRAGGDDVPAINPLSCWDAGFRPACPNPHGMAFITLPDGSRSWVDIYLLGVDHATKGTSRLGETIADGADLPVGPGGGDRVKRLDYATAVAIYAAHGKQLLTYDEFRVAAFGVTEKSAAKREPKKTALDAPRTSAAGIIQATGNMWIWGTDGDPDEPRPGIFGGSWLLGDGAGSRCADLDYWPDFSLDLISARGRCDHLEA